MSRSADHDSSWVEALHDSIVLRSRTAIAADSATVANSEPPDDPEFAEIQDCLLLLERARRSQPSTDNIPQRVGRFEVVRQVGRGGFGIVFEAFDPQLVRRVALKVPRPEVLVDVDARERFLREARAAGALEHPNLIPMYEAGEDGPFCYLASAYCEGPNLAEWLKQRQEPVPERQAAELVRQLALAVQHAHGRGVLHRDIKPSNVLLDSSTENEAAELLLTPRLTDFGLARLLEYEGDETRSGILLGTPAYMAPEQALGQIRKIGPATDIYALGVLLYELLAGQAPFVAESQVHTLQLVAAGEIAPLSRYRVRMPRDLEAIVRKCLAAKPEDRYATAQQLAEDLERFLSGQPTVARPPAIVERLAKWARRRPALASIFAALAAALVALFAVVIVYNARLSEEVARADAQRDRAEQESEAVRRLLYAADVRLAGELLKGKDIVQAMQVLAQQIPIAGEEDLRGFTWYLLHQQCEAETLNLEGHDGDVFGIAWSPDGRQIATAGKDGTVRTWNAETGQPQHVLRGHTDEVTCVIYSRDGNRILSGSEDATVRYWNPLTGAAGPILRGHDDHVMALAVSPNGKYAASGGRDQRLRIWDTRTRKLIHKREMPGAVRAVAFSGDSTWLHAGDEAGNLNCYWAATGGRHYHRYLHNEKHFALASHPDGRRLVAAGRLEVFRVWSTAHALLLHEQPAQHREWVQALAFSPSGDRLASGGKDCLINLWNGSDLSFRRTLLGHTARVWGVAWSPDGQALASAGGDGAKIWNTLEGPPATYPPVPHSAYPGEYSPDSKQLYVAGYERVYVFDVATKRELASVAAPFHSGDCRCSSDGKLLAVSNKKILQIWNCSDLSVRHTISTPHSAGDSIAWRPGSHHLACSLETGSVALIDADSGQVLRTFVIKDNPRSVLFSAGGSRLLVLANGWTVWDVESGQRLHHTDDSFWDVAESEKNSVFALSESTNVVLIDSHSYALLARLMTGQDDIHGLAISGDTLAIATHSPPAVSLWDLRTRQILLTLPIEGEAISDVRFSPDGRRLMAIGYGDRIDRVIEWELPTGD